jgi:hypothetical protein
MEQNITNKKAVILMPRKSDFKIDQMVNIMKESFKLFGCDGCSSGWDTSIFKIGQQMKQSTLEADEVLVVGKNGGVRRLEDLEF